MPTLVTEEKLKRSAAGGALVGKRNGQTIIHNNGTLGGYAAGKLHSEGGIKGEVKTNGQKIEFQGSEVVITAPAVADNTLHNFNGKKMTNRQILSHINESGGGVSFADGGEIPAMIKTTGKKHSYNGKMLADHKIVKHCGCGCMHAEKGGQLPAAQLKKAIKIINKLKPTRGLPQYEISIAQQRPNEFLQMIADQALGYTRRGDGTRSPKPHEGGAPIAEVYSKYGKTLTGIAIELYPAEKFEEKKVNDVTAGVKKYDYIDVIDAGGKYGSIIKRVDDKRVWYEVGSPGHEYLESALKSDLMLLNNDGKLVDDADWDAEYNHNYWEVKKTFASGGELKNIWLSVDDGPPVSFEEFYSINNETDGVEPLSADDIEAIKNLKINQVWGGIGAGGAAVKRVDGPDNFAAGGKIKNRLTKDERVTIMLANGFLSQYKKTFNEHQSGYENTEKLIKNLSAAPDNPDNITNAILYLTVYNENIHNKTVDKIIADLKLMNAKYHFKNGGKITAAFTDYQEKILFRLHMHPNSFVTVDKAHINMLQPLQDAGYIYSIKNPKKYLENEIWLTETGKRLVNDYSFKTSNKSCGGTILPDIDAAKGAAVAPNFKYYKGISFNYSNAFELNKAIEEFIDHLSPGETLAPEEKVFLSYYSGYGGLEKFGATGKGLLYEYFTPDPIVQKMWALAYKHGFKGGKVKEPSCGSGIFIKYAPEQSQVTGYEINEYSYKICKLLYPAADIKHAAFETIFIKNNSSIKNRVDALPKYDLIIGNPPYGEFGGLYAGMGEKAYTKADNYIDYFIFRGLDLLNKNGLLVMIIGTEVANGGIPWLQKPINKIKMEIAMKAVLLDAYRLPNGVFDRTDVLSDIIVLQKI